MTERLSTAWALINIVTLYTVMYNDIMYIRNYKKNLNIAESTSLQNVNPKIDPNFNVSFSAIACSSTFHKNKQ
jgi:hypothetical protein